MERELFEKLIKSIEQGEQMAKNYRNLRKQLSKEQYQEAKEKMLEEIDSLTLKATAAFVEEMKRFEEDGAAASALLGEEYDRMIKEGKLISDADQGDQGLVDFLREASSEDRTTDNK